jgi:hypothetical protein
VDWWFTHKIHDLWRGRQGGGDIDASGTERRSMRGMDGKVSCERASVRATSGSTGVDYFMNRHFEYISEYIL